MTQPCTYQPTKNLFAMDGMAGYEQVDPTTLVWSVRPGMAFHNGDPVDAEAVAYSWSRLAKLWDALGATHVRRDGFDFVDAFEATDALTVTERWSRPNADALIHRSRHYYSFINPRMVEAFGAIEGVIERADGATEDVPGLQELPFGSGSGPYVLTKRDDTGTRVERWPDYHRHTPTDDGFVEDGPHIDAWETRILDYYSWDGGDAKDAFLAGELDVYGWIKPDELPEFEGLDHIAVTEIPNAGYAFIGMDGGKFHDKRARQALQKAFDYEGFIETVRPLGGRYAAPISDVLPHYQRLSQQELREWYRHDPAEARALWEAADFAVPVDKVTVYGIPSWPILDAIREFAARSLAATLGIETDVEVIDHGESWVTQRSEVKRWELLPYGTGEAGGTTGIPHDSQLIHYDPRAYGFNAFNHYIGSSRPEIDSDARTIAGMLDAQERILDPDDRADLLTGIQRWILDRHWCNWALPVNAVYHWGFSARLRDHAPDDWWNFYDRRRESMWLADAQPSAST